MTEKEKMEFYLAMCSCCVLAQVMKACARCQFNIGLTEQVKSEDSMRLPLSTTGRNTTMAKQSQFNKVSS